MRRLFLLWFLLLAQPSYADDEGWASRDYDYAKNTLDDFYDRKYWDMVSPMSKRPREKLARAASTAIAARRQPRMPDVLAAHIASDTRAAHVAFFRKMLVRYGEFERLMQVPKNDLAVAVASLIAISYQSYVQVELDDTTFKRLIEQTRTHLTAMPDFMKLPLADKQDMFEHAAIISMTMLAARAAHIDIRASAKQYLEGVLKVDANRIEVTKQGISIRD